MQFYVFKNNEQIGPLPLLEVRERLKKGELDYTDLAWRDGLQDWTSLRELMGGALPDATPHAVSPSSTGRANGGPRTLRLVTAVVIFVLAFVAIGVAAWLVASFVCGVTVAAQSALGHGTEGGVTSSISAGEDTCRRYFYILAGSAGIFSLVLSPVVAWMLAYSNFFPWCRARL